MIRIIFQKRDPTLFAGLIRWWTGSPYSHCEIVFSDGVMFSSHLADKGTRYVQGVIRPDFWDGLWIPTTLEDEIRIRRWCDSELYCRYDWKGIFLSQFLKLQREHPDKWFCSEICAAIVQMVGFLKGMKPCSLSPGKLYTRLRNEGAEPCEVW